MYCAVFPYHLAVRDYNADSPEDAARQHVEALGKVSSRVHVTWEVDGELRCRSFDTETFEEV